MAGLRVTLPASVLYVTIVGEGRLGGRRGVRRSARHLPLALTIFVIVVFIARLCEEIVYRGLLWGAVERHGARPCWPR